MTQPPHLERPDPEIGAWFPAVDRAAWREAAGELADGGLDVAAGVRLPLASTTHS